MKKSLLALALLGAFAGVAQAQTAVTIYGTLDAGINKRSDTTVAVGKRDNNKLGFKGTEDLGSNNLKALFQLEIRYEPDTGTNESVTRPLFQGQSRVGLSGDFGMIRLGRGLTAYMESADAFDPWNGIPSVAGFKTDLLVAGYTSDPLSPAGNSGNRFSNAAFYNSPEFSGFQVNATVGTKEANNGPALIGRGTAGSPQYGVNAEAAMTPFSFSGTYKNGPMAAMLAYERNAVESKLVAVGVSLMALPELKLVADLERQNQEHTMAANPITKAWVIGANYTIGAGKILAGVGEKGPDGASKTKQFSLGYEYSLSKRTYLYAEASTKKIATTVKYYGLGIHHNF